MALARSRFLVVRKRRCPTCRGLEVLGEGELRCYSCAKVVEDLQKRLGARIEEGEDGSG